MHQASSQELFPKYYKQYSVEMKPC